MAAPREKLMKTIFDLAGISAWRDVRVPLPVVPLALFFDGNDDISSIGCNLLQHPGIAKFASVLSAIEARDDVQDVRVSISEVEDVDDIWPFTDHVFFLTSADVASLETWLQDLEPDVVTEVAEDDEEVVGTPGLPARKAGMRILAAWWD